MIHNSVNDAKKQTSGCGGGSNQDQHIRQQQQNEMIQNSLKKIKNKLLVLSGKGGVGKSSVSSNLAVSLAKKGFKTGLMDVDLHGPSIAQMFGITDLLDMASEKKQLLAPSKVMDNLSVVTIQALMQDKDQAVIWRGPAKTGMINQFIANVDWGELDFLIIDAPPGTGDEPISIAQAIPDAKGIIVTTPQEVALADIRKSISFCKTVKIKTLGILENMGAFKCPHCTESIELFSSGGGKATAEQFGLNFLGSIPFDINIGKSGDSGKPLMMQEADSEFSKNFEKIVANITKQL
jgi:ATP-binding protein involved in chromosome partitioning